MKREFNGVKERVNVQYVFMESIAFKLGFDRWGTFLTHGNAGKRERMHGSWRIMSKCKY